MLEGLRAHRSLPQWIPLKQKEGACCLASPNVTRSPLALGRTMPAWGAVVLTAVAAVASGLLLWSTPSTIGVMRQRWVGHCRAISKLAIFVTVVL